MRLMKFTKVKACLLTAGLLAFGYTATAQEMADLEDDGMPDRAGTVDLGFKVGPTFSYFGYNFEASEGDLQNTDNGGTQKGFFANVYATYHVNNWLATRIEAGWLQTGQANSTMAIGGQTTPVIGEGGSGTNPMFSRELVDHNVSFVLNHVDIPVLFVIDPPQIWERWSPSFYAGPAFGINVYSYRESIRQYDNTTTINGVSYVTRETRASGDNVNSQIRRMDYGALMGASITYPLENRSYDIVFDFRYRMGLNNINNTQNALRGIPVDATTNTIMVGVGLEF
jgi:hypothetical protein